MKKKYRVLLGAFILIGLFFLFRHTFYVEPHAYLKAQAEGMWVSSGENEEQNHILISFKKGNQSTITYTRYKAKYEQEASFQSHITWTKRGVRGEGTAQTFYEGVFDFENDNWGHAGVGYLYVKDGRMDVKIIHLKSNGSFFGTHTSTLTYAKPKDPFLSFSFALKKVRENVSMKKVGYLVDESVTYTYASEDGKYFKKIHYIEEDGRLYQKSEEYRVTSEGVIVIDQEGRTQEWLMNPIRKGESWGKKGELRTVLSTDYYFSNELKKVVVIEDERMDRIEYFHADIGLLGWGKEQGEYDYVLVDIEKKSP